MGGFQLLSITEDIHTSQKLHAAGLQLAFVDEDLAVGLSAETLQGYLVQRRRWMLGCLQIFFRDNPLLQRGLPLRHRVGYFASLWYFFFPLARVAFFVTPLWYLLFHLHPLFADLPVLLAYLVPHLALAALAASALVRLAATPAGRGLRGGGGLPARARDLRPRPPEAARLQGDAQGGSPSAAASTSPRPG